MEKKKKKTFDKKLWIKNCLNWKVFHGWYGKMKNELGVSEKEKKKRKINSEIWLVGM